MAKRRKNCNKLNGVLLLDKPAGLSSNQALQEAKQLLRACKAGHTGSIDPIATGLLPLCFGEATKISQFLLDADKRYWTVIKLGESTDSYDSEGEVIERRPVKTDKKKITHALREFMGEIEQVPPMFSAVKQGGQALYKLARKGIAVEREPRTVTIHDLKLLSFEGDRLELDITCSKGTYIRTLAHDLGELLGCGAHVAELRRLQVGNFKINQSVTLDTLRELEPAQRVEKLLPIDWALSDLPDVNLTALAAHYLLQGQPVSVRHPHPPGWVRLYQEGELFLGMGQVLDDGRVAPKRLMRATRKA